MKNPTEMTEQELWEAGYVPAYQNNKPENLIAGMRCVYCDMNWYNCVCCHED